MPVIPSNCAADDGGAGVDVESLVLCDFDANGDVVGSALAVYTYDDEGVAVGPPTFVDPITGDPYTAQGTLRPCGDPSSFDAEVLILCDEQEDQTFTQFVRTIVYGHDNGQFVRNDDRNFDGTPYFTMGVVGDCNPVGRCIPDSAQDAEGVCTTPHEVNVDDVVRPGDARVNNDTTADVMCTDGSAWAPQRQVFSAPFPIDEPLNTADYNDPDVSTFGHAYLTAVGGEEGVDANRLVTDQPGQGWLRLTNGPEGGPEAGGIVFNSAFPSTEDVVVEFDLAIHTPTTNGFRPANGMSVFLLDGTQPIPTEVGTRGGPLGYSAANPAYAPPGFDVSGIDGGIIGIGIDRYGAFGNEDFGTGGYPATPGQDPPEQNMLVIRGSGDNGDWNDGSYQFVDGVQAPVSLDTFPRTNPMQVRLALIRRNGRQLVTMDVDFRDGQGFVRYFEEEDATAAIPSIPAQYRIGFAGTTGGQQEVHEIRNLRVTPAGVQNWRAFNVDAEVPDCADTVTLSVSVDVTITADSQVETNADNEVYLWIVDTTTNTIVERREFSSVPSRVGDTRNISVQTDPFPKADLPNYDIYVGAEVRDQDGSYSQLWEDFTVQVTAIGCPQTAVKTTPISAPCPIDVNVIGGSGEGDAVPVTVVNTPDAISTTLVCADGANAIRREVRTADGETRVEFVGASGTPIVPAAWTPGECVPTQLDTEVLALCDEGNGGQRFLRRVAFNGDGTPASSVDLNYDGTPYAPVGPVGSCPGPDSDITVTDDPICVVFNPGEPATQQGNGILRTVYADGVQASQVFLDGGGNPVAEPINWTYGACTRRDIHVQLVCADGEPTFRLTTYDGDGIIASERFERDQGNPPGNVVSWTPGPCVAEPVEDADTTETTWCLDGQPAVRLAVRSELTGDIEVIWGDAAGNVITPTPAQVDAATPGPCQAPTGEAYDVEVTVLCDHGDLDQIGTNTGPTSYLLHTVYEVATGDVVRTETTTLDGETAYVPVGPSYDCGEYTSSTTTAIICRTVDRVTMIQQRTSVFRGAEPLPFTTLVRAYESGDLNNVLHPADDEWTYGACYRDAQVLESVWCFDGQQVIREHAHTYAGYDVEPTFGTRWFLADATEVFPTPAEVAAATFGPCTVGIDEVPTGWESICYRTVADGEILPGTKRHQDDFPAPGFMVFDASGNPVNTAAPGYEQVVCSPEAGPQVIGEGCYLLAGETRRWASMIDSDGVVTLVDVRDGSAVDPATVTDCRTEIVETSQMVIMDGAQLSIPNSSDLTAWQVRHRSGTVTVQVNSGPINTLDAGEVAGASAQSGSILDDQVIVGGTGSARVIFTQRN